METCEAAGDPPQQLPPPHDFASTSSFSPPQQESPQHEEMTEALEADLGRRGRDRRERDDLVLALSPQHEDAHDFASGVLVVETRLTRALNERTECAASFNFVEQQDWRPRAIIALQMQPKVARVSIWRWARDWCPTQAAFGSFKRVLASLAAELEEWAAVEVLYGISGLHDVACTVSSQHIQQPKLARHLGESSLPSQWHVSLAGRETLSMASSSLITVTEALSCPFG